MKIIDTHAHLYLPELEPDLGLVLDRARQAGVEQIICVGVDLASSRRCVELARAFPAIVFASAGIHPNRCANAGPSDLQEIATLAQASETVAIGETGFDFHYTYTQREMQAEFFREHIRLALAVNKPLIIHARESDAETLTVLREADQPLRGVRHCFDGSLQTASSYTELGLSIALGGAITREGHRKLKAAAAALPEQRLLLETDCPYQTPVGAPQPRNEPAFIVQTARALAALRGAETEQIAELTTLNAARLFLSGAR